VDANTPVADPRTLDDILGSQTRDLRLYVCLLGLFALVALLLASTGIYSVTAYAAAERTREVGIRMALGASKQHIMLMMLRQAGATIATGLAAGAAGILLLRPAAKALLSGINGFDPLTCAAVVAVLLAAAVAACIVPTRRAAAVNPNQALKYE
jgi:ABC-type antimicrobial peptide transport system permease subunit